MMSVVTGLFSEPLNLLRTAVSESATFQSAIGAADATEALASVYYEITEEDDLSDAAKRPCAVVYIAEWEFPHFATDPSVIGDWTISVVLLQDAQRDLDNDENEEFLLFVNYIEDVLDDMITYLSGRGYRRIGLGVPPMRTPRNQRRYTGDGSASNDYYRCRLDFSNEVSVE